MGDEYEYQCHVGIWDDIGGMCPVNCFFLVMFCVSLGFKMSCMKEDVLKEAVIMSVDQYSLISSDDVIKVR